LRKPKEKNRKHTENKERSRQRKIKITDRLKRKKDDRKETQMHATV
jgi:hypothetical protein